MFGVNGLAVVKNDLVETYSETSFQTDLTNFLAYMKQHGRKETTIRTYDSAIRFVYDATTTLGQRWNVTSKPIR